MPRLDRLTCQSDPDDNDMFSGVWKASVSGLLTLPIAAGGVCRRKFADMKC